ncbi:MAG TPA: bifunctional nuclease family protein [Anaeromyxobacteraceae bacterium]
MRASPWEGRLLVPLLLAASVALLVGAAPRAGTPQDLVEMEVLGVVPLESEAASLLVLRQKGGPAVLPIFVGRNEGAAIDLRLKRKPSPHPRAADLLEKAIAALGGKVTRVEIQGVQATLFRARVTLQQGERRLEVEARPSDSVALAMASRAPIFATREVMAEAGLTKEDLDRLRGHPGKPHDDERVGLGPVHAF